MSRSDSSSAIGSRFLLSAAACVVVIAGLKAAQSIIIPTMLSAILAILCVPLVSFLRRRRVPTAVAVVLVVLVVMGVLAGIGAILGGSVNDFTEEIPKYESRLDTLLNSTKAWLVEQGIKVEALDLFEVADPGAIMNMVGGMLRGMMAALSNTILVLLLLVFILLEATGFSTKLKAIAGHPDADIDRYQRMTDQVQQYLFIKTLTSLATGIVIGIWLMILGVDFPILWGLLAFLLNYIPNLGSIIAALPAVLLALIQLGPGHAIAATAGFLVVNLVIGSLIEPNLMGRRLGLSTLVVFLSLVFWGWVWGPVGMLLSVPLTMIVKISLENTQDLRWIAILLDSPTAVELSLQKPSPNASSERPTTEEPANRLQ